MTQRNKNPRGVYEKIPGSNIWWIRYAGADGKIHREVAGSKSSAIKLRHKRKGFVVDGRKLPELRKRVVTFDELCDDYRAYAEKHNEGFAVDARRIARFKEAFGGGGSKLPTYAELQAWFDAQSWAPATINRERTCLRRIFEYGIERELITENPAQKIRRTHEPMGRPRYLTTAEETRLRKIVNERYPPHLVELVIALNTGMRRSEQYLRIDWSCVDLLRRELYIPKSKNGEPRHIPLNVAALTAFKELRQRTEGQGPVFPASRKRASTVAALLGPRHWFEDAVAQAKLENFTWHCLRHTFASRLVMAGVDLRTVADLMGHRTIQMTMRYAHLAPEHKARAVAKFDAAVVSSLESIETHENEKRTDTRTDTGEKGSPAVAEENVN